MPITTSLAACSTTVANNGPDGAVDAPSTLDDSIRYSLSFIAQLRDTKAPLESPAFTGTPTAPTVATADNSTTLATTAFVKSAVVAGQSGVASFNGRSGAVALAGTDISSAGGALSTALAAATGSALIGTYSAGLNVVLRTVQDKLRDVVSVKDFGAVGDGVTDDTVALTNAKTYIQSRGGMLFFPVGTYIVSNISALQFTAGEILLIGEGYGSIIKAANNAALNYVISYSGSGTLRVENLAVDGNKANGGTQFNNGYLLYLTGLHAKIRNVELRNSVFCGVFVGSNTTAPAGIEFDGCFVHDNGGTAANGNGCGIYAGGTQQAQDVRIINCRFEDNYNKGAAPGLSNALNMSAIAVTVTGCYFKNNLNNNGGQVDINDGGTGAISSRMVITGNTIEQSVYFAAESTCGIEIQGRKVVCNDNLIVNASSDGIRLESSAGDGVVANNVITCNVVGINLITSGGTGIVNTSVRGNQILAANTGIQVQAGASIVILESNYIYTSIATKLSGFANCFLVRNNYGINPLLAAISAPAVAASTVAVTNNTHVDCNIYITAASGGSVSVAIGGTPTATILPNAVGSVFVSAGSSITLTYNAAPTWVWLGQ